MPKPSALTSAFDGLKNLVAGLGGSRDKRAYTFWDATTALDHMTLESMYRSSWLAKRIVDAPAEDMTREGAVFKFERSGDMLEGISKAEVKFQLWAKLLEAVQWARLYGGSVIIIGIKGQDTEKPLDVNTVGTNQLSYLHVMDRTRITPGAVMTSDITSPNFGLPETYYIADSSIQVHYTRLVRFTGQRLPWNAWVQNGRWDDSELQHVYDSLVNADTTTAAVATMIFEANVDVISTPDLGELLSTKAGEAKALQRFQSAAMMKSFNRTLLLDGAETYEKKSNSFANLDKIMDKFYVDVCGAAEIPMTRLYGQSPGGLNATGNGELTNYYDAISNKQEAKLRDQLDVLYKVLLLSELGAYPDDFSFDFKPLWQMSDAEKATLEKTKADRDRVYYDMGVVSEGLIARTLMADGTYPSMTDEDVELAEELALEPEPEPEPEPVVAAPGALPGEVDEQGALPEGGAQEEPPTTKKPAPNKEEEA